MSWRSGTCPASRRQPTGHPGDLLRSAQETRELYRAEGVSPYAGFLPLLVQIPVFLVLYRLFSHATGALSGARLLGVPLRERFTNFDPDPAFGLIPLPRVESYRGFVFVSLSPSGISLREHLGRGCEYLADFCDRAPEAAGGAAGASAAPKR